MMRALVTGGNGLLGRALTAKLKKEGWQISAPSHQEMDITCQQQVEQVFREFRPEIVFHCAAYTQVDQAEEEQELCRKINAEGTRIIACCCGKQEVKLVYLSTDYVFSGEGSDFQKAEDPTGPLNVYGESKLEGEQAVRDLAGKFFIVRTSWLFGEKGEGFPQKILTLSKTQQELKVVADQVGSPTYAPDLAETLAEMARSERYGIYHVTNEGICSWYEFAAEILRSGGWTGRLTPVRTDELGLRARRPLNSRLNKGSLDKAGFRRLPEWQDGLKRCFRKINMCE